MCRLFPLDVCISYCAFYIMSRNKNTEGKDDRTGIAEIIKLGQEIASQTGQPSRLVQISSQIIP